MWDTEDDALIKPSRLVHWPGYPISPVLGDDAVTRHNRQFYRFGRAYPAYQDKRFLRFGRSHLPDVDDYASAVFFQPDEPLYRKRRSTQAESQSDLLHRTVRSTESNQPSAEEKRSLAGKDLQKRETDTDHAENSDHFSYDKVLNDDQNLDKRFMRFGKRFMRFGRGNEEDSDYDKRFMRFGKSTGDDQEFDKRFMRFGKRFMRFGRGDEEDESNEKRFMRFGKSGDFDKRFMRFGKRFLRFGRGDEDSEAASANLDGELEDKRFMRFGKRSTRSAAIEHNSNSHVAAAS